MRRRLEPLDAPFPPELYSYTEEPELSHNRRCFEEDFHSQGELWAQHPGPGAGAGTREGPG